VDAVATWQAAQFLDHLRSTEAIAPRKPAFDLPHASTLVPTGDPECAELARSSAVVARVMLSLLSRARVVGDTRRVSALRPARSGSSARGDEMLVAGAKQEPRHSASGLLSRKSSHVSDVAGHLHIDE
jgi:hypothetical protein